MSAAHTEGPRLFGLMAEFNDPDVLVEKTRQAREAGYEKMDTYSPFPIHGLSEALGIKRNWVPYVVLFGALLGGIGGFMLQYWTAAIDYPINIGGRPLNSWPAFMVITFESAVLLAGVIGIVGMLALNKLPLPYHPVFSVPRFQLASQDRFFLCIFEYDPQFDMEKTRKFLESLGPEGVYEVEQDDDSTYD